MGILEFYNWCSDKNVLGSLSVDPQNIKVKLTKGCYSIERIMEPCELGYLKTSCENMLKAFDTLYEDAL